MATQLENYSGVFFRKYGKKVLETFTPNAVILRKLPVEEKTRTGESFDQGVLLTEEQGATYAKNNSGSFALEEAVDGEVKYLRVLPSNHVFRGNLSYEAVAASLGEGTASEKLDGRVAMSLRNNAQRRIEMGFLTGRTGLGVIESVGTNEIVITQKTWAGARWVGMKNAKVDILSPDLATQRDGTGTSGEDFYKITGVVNSTRTVALDDDNAIQVGDIVFFHGEVIAGGTPVHNSCLGLHEQLGESLTDFFGLDPTTYSTLMGNVVDADDEAPSFDMIQTAIALTMDMGNDAESMVCLVNPHSFARINSDLAASRRWDGSYTKNKGEMGFRSITFNSPIGDIDIIPHPLVWRGYAYGFAWEDLRRPGSFDLSFMRPASGASRTNFEGTMLAELPDNAGYQVRLFHNSAILDTIPSHGFRIDNIDDEAE